MNKNQFRKDPITCVYYEHFLPANYISTNNYLFWKLRLSVPTGHMLQKYSVKMYGLSIQYQNFAILRTLCLLCDQI